MVISYKKLLYDDNSLCFQCEKSRESKPNGEPCGSELKNVCKISEQVPSCEEHPADQEKDGVAESFIQSRVI